MLLRSAKPKNEAMQRFASSQARRLNDDDQKPAKQTNNSKRD